MGAGSGDWSFVVPVGDLLVRAAEAAPDRLALVLPAERRTYAQLLDGARGVARSLWALGVRPGDHVGLFAPNGVEFVEGLFGAQLVGAVVVPLNVRHKAAELRYVVDHAQLVAVLTTDAIDDHVDLAAVLRDALPGLDAADPERLALAAAPRLRAVGMLRGEDKAGCVGASRLAALGADVAHRTVERARRTVRVRDTALILYTSGTTANPKGCMLSHEAVTRGPVGRSTGRFRSDADHEVYWGPGPLFHIGALSPYMGCVGCAGTYLTDVNVDPGRALALMTEHGVTSAWPWFPAVTAGILDHPAFDAARLGRLRFVGQIGPRPLFERIRDELPGVEIFKSSGMTETAGSFGLSTPDETFDERVEHQGRPIPGVEVRVVDPETGAELPHGTMGELHVRGFCVTDGYYREPEKTAATIDADRWLRTGDLYSHLEDDSLVFHGRIKDMLKVGGENVAALELEEFLCRHPDVVSAEVVGRPDARLDEVPFAFVELRPGAALTLAELAGFCTGRVASYKVPRGMHVMEPGSWPMSSTKVDKRALRARLSELDAAPHGA
jgi:acyl-CoA synthetase (AMP-forming)/AMP-acid ligase II